MLILSYNLNKNKLNNISFEQRFKIIPPFWNFKSLFYSINYFLFIDLIDILFEIYPNYFWTKIFIFSKFHFWFIFYFVF